MSTGTLRKRKLVGSSPPSLERVGFVLADGFEPSYSPQQLIEKNILNVITATQGYVYGDPFFGVDLSSLLFDPGSKSLGSQIAAILEQQIKRQVLSSVSVVLSGEATQSGDKATIPLRISYVYKGIQGSFAQTVIL